MFYLVESDKSFYEACFDLEPVIQRLGFVILHAHDLGEMLRGKDAALDDDCKVFAVGNYRQTERLLAIDMRLSMLLPWRISVFTENGATKIGIARPETLFAALGGNPELVRVAREVEEKLVQMVDETR